MSLSKNTSMGLVIVGVALVVIALLEHFLVTTEILPHLGIYLVILGVIVGAVGAWGMMGSRAS